MKLKEKKYLIIILGLLLVTFGLGIFYKLVLADLPNVNLIFSPPILSTKILDRQGNLLYKFYNEENRTWIPIDRIPKTLINATLAIEDKTFYRHHGLSIKGVIEACFYNLREKDRSKLRGGSTITQQLVKNVFLTKEQTWERKIKELVLSVLVEFKLKKSEILERYFNQVAYGGETYGVQEAALKYFGKNVWEINDAEATFLAGLPAAPSSYSPFGSNPELANSRQRRVIAEMLSAKFITKEKAEEISNTKINIISETKNIKAPHFVFWIRDILQQKYGFENFERQGLTITTSLDSNIQKLAESITLEEVEKVKRLRISNGASLVIDVKTGDVLAMVGSKDYFATDIDGKYNVTTALRQPGSSIKPINYLLAFKSGMTLATTVDDNPITYPSQVKGQKPYSPQNYNGRYMGMVNLKTALASSLNIPSVKILNQNGINNMIDLAEQMGITTWQDRSRFGLALALGGGEVKMTELAGAYTIFANMGQKIEINPILKIDDYLGRSVYQKNVEKRQIFEPEYAFLINTALSDDNARAPVFGLNSKLKIKDKTVAVKTGTTNNLKDNWCIGWTPSFLVAAWVGNNDSKPMSWVASGVSGATPIWNRIMKEILNNQPDEKWTIPSGMEKMNVCGKSEYFIYGTEQNVTCPPPPSPTPTVTP